MNIRIIDAVLDIFDHYGEHIRFDIERFENALNDENPDLLDECFLVVDGMKKGIFDAMIFDEDIDRRGYVDYLTHELSMNEEDALFLVVVFDELIHQIGYYFEVGNMDSLLQLAYQQDNFHTIYIIAKAYYQGFGVQQDYEKAFELFSYLYAHGDYSGSYYIGYMYEYGYGVEKDIEKAFMYYSSHEDDLCCLKMGLSYMLGEYVGYDHEKAYEYFDKSHDKDAYLYKGLLLENEHDYSGAFQSYFEGARLFQEECLYKIGMYLNRGLGTELNQDRAYRYFTYGYYCLHGDSTFQLAMMFYDGIVIQKDKNYAIELLKQAAKLNSRDACLMLARFYELGQNVDKNIHLSMKYYQKANEIYEYIKQTQINGLRET